MNLVWKRTLRTNSSERFLATRDGRDVAAVDLHHLADGTVAGTVIVLEDSRLSESDIPPLLRSLDEDFLPGVDAREGSLAYTVVIGRVLGNWESVPEGK
ncbi:MAG: hypothetical protein FJ298_07675 [Planctomycetes bacterium]|nr:hypothetical protein [Planctomycetota bacterium]